MSDNLIGGNGSKFTWQFVFAMATIIGSVIAGSVWIGQIQQQSANNAARLLLLEAYAHEGRTQHANTIATLRDLDHRLERLEQFAQRRLEQLSPRQDGQK